MIRLATHTDIDRVYEIEELAFIDDAWSRASIEVEFYKDYSHIYVYDENDFISGYVILWVLGLEVEILTIATDPKFQHNGIAFKLLDHTMRLYNKCDWFLEVEESNSRAIKLYNKFGFKKFGIINNYYGKDRQAIRMALKR